MSTNYQHCTDCGADVDWIYMMCPECGSLALEDVSDSDPSGYPVAQNNCNHHCVIEDQCIECGATWPGISD